MIINMPVIHEGCTLPPRPISGVSATIINYKDGINEFNASWTLGEVYDVQVGKINIYGYVGEEVPTDFSQFELDTEVNSTDISVNTYLKKPYNYILVAPVSTDGAVQKDLSQMCEVALTLDMPVKVSFADMSWEDIAFVSENGYASKYFSVGDTKTVSIVGTSYKVAIHDFNHDELADGSGKYAGMTIGLVNCLSSPTSQMYTTDSNIYGWGSSNVRTTLRNTVYPTLPEELRNVIKDVYKKTSEGGKSTTIKTTTDNLFLFSESEVYSTNYAVGGEGSRYPYYTTTTNRNKTVGDTSTTTANWWTRSPYKTTNTSFVYFYTDGSTSKENVLSANTTAYITFGFCV